MSENNFSVPIKSRIPANFDDKAFIHVRRLASGPFEDANARPQVVMVAGRTTPALVSLDLQSEVAGGKFSWARAIAEAGIDVWIMEVQGMGKSSRPDVMNNKCNILPSQQGLIFDKASQCAPEYPMHLGHSESEWHELNEVVKHVQGVTGQFKVILIGYSAGAYVVGPYAMQNPSKVRGLLLFAPIFPPGGPPSPTSIAVKPTQFGPLLIPPVSSPKGFYGAPMGIVTKETMPKPRLSPLPATDPTIPSLPIDRRLRQQAELIEDIWQAYMDSETGTFETGTSMEVSRHPTRFWWGWNDALVKANPNLGNDIPVLIINGLDDDQANQKPEAKNDGRGRFWVPDLYDAISGHRKLMYDIEQAGHVSQWEEPHRHRLHKLSIDWLTAYVGYGNDVTPGPRDFPFEGTGRFFVPFGGAAPKPWNGHIVPSLPLRRPPGG